MPSDVSSALPLSPRAFYVLVALAEEDTHGYALSKRIENMSGGIVRITGGTLYPLIKQMLDDGWIAETTAAPGDPRRRAYRLTLRGRRIARAEAVRLSDLLHAARDCDLLPAGALA
jgi:DNA-binding PadR family transcriptional regulator